MFTSISAGVGNLPCFPNFFSSLLKIPNFSLYLHLTFFCNIIMTGEPTHTTSKERMAPELMFSFEHTPKLSIIDLKVKWLCSAITQRYKDASAINPVTTEHAHLQTGSHACIALL